MKRRLIALTLALLAALLPFMAFSAQPAAESMQKFSYMFFGTFDTAITLIGFAPSQAAFDAIAAQVEEQFTSLHEQFNQYYPYEGLNNLYYVNRHAAEQPVRVPQDLFDLLQWCKLRQPETRGQVNIAMGAVLALWHDERENAEADPASARLPDMASLKEAALHTSMDDVILNEADRTVFFRDPLLKLDVGAVAKGYAAERVAQFLLGSGMPSFIINAGGNVRTGNPPLDGRATWGVAIQDPNVEIILPNGDDAMDVLFLSNRSLVTSGDYQRYYTVDGIRYHHLISPETLMPPHHFRSVTIITEDSAYADLLSTAVFLMPYEQGRAFVESLPGVDAFWVLNDHSIKMTKGAEKISYTMGYRP